MALFAHKTIDSGHEDVNAGAASLRYEEVRSRSTSSDAFLSAAPLQFDFSAAGRHILLSESYFEVRYKAGYSPIGADATAQAATNLRTDIVKLAANLKDGTGVSTAADMDIALRTRWFNSCISNVRHTINGAQVASNNEPAATSWLNDQCTQAAGYSSKAASAYNAQHDIEEREAQLTMTTSQACAYVPPLGLWSSNVAIPGSTQHSITLDVMSHASYSARVWDARTPTTVLAADQFHHFGSSFPTKEKNRYYMAIDSVVLRLATVAAQDMRMAPPNMVIETREIEATRISGGAIQNLSRAVTMPGSLYKVSAHFVGAVSNSPVEGIGEPEAGETTVLSTLSLTCDGQLLQQPEYSFQGLALRPYTDMLAANGNKDSESGPTGCHASIADWTRKPFYVARVVQPITNNKELMIRATFDNATAQKTAVLASWYTHRISLNFDENGNCINVMTNN